MMKVLTAACLLFLGGVSAESRVQMESDVTVFSSANWQQSSRVSSDEELTLQFFLRHDPEQVANFEAELYKRASPSSPLYAQWFSPEEVTARLAPPKAHVDLVSGYLLASGVSSYSVNTHRDVISFTAKASVVEDIIGTELYHYTHAKFSKVDIVRVAAPYSLPTRIAAVTSVVAELIRFPHLRDSPVVEVSIPHASSDDAWSQCGTKYQEFTNIAVLQERYGFPDVSSVASGAGIALAEFQGQYYDDGDLEAFSSQCNIDTITVDSVVGGNNPSRCEIGLEPCIESLLDIEYAGAVAKTIPLSIYYFSTYSLLDWAQTVNDDNNTAPVHSVSYGNDEVQQTSNDYMYSCNTEFMKLGSKGVSVFFASGDQGVWGRTGYSATGTFHPDFPADSPYITAVGGTDFATKGTIGDESTWADGGGGFSNVFAQPSWQADAVNAFLESDDLPASRYYNATGRGYPDVAALAGTQNAYFISYKDGKFTGVGGTSAASPVVASIFAIVVNERMAAGKTSMGWLNPFIYENSGAFNDVTSGTNDAGNSPGFTATTGWDAATGFGTPNYDALLSAAMSV